MKTVKITPAIVFNALMFAGFLYVVMSAADWRIGARLFPWAIGIPAVLLLGAQLVLDQVRARKPLRQEAQGGLMDLPVDADTPPAVVVRRAGIAFGWVLGLFLGIWLVGFLVAVPAYVVAYTTVMAKSKWYESLGYVAVVLLLLLGVFHFILHIPWLIPLIPWPQDAIISLIGG